MNDDGLLKMAELADQSGVSSGTIKHYLREGLLPEPVRTSRNMAYYPPDFVERIRLIKRLQEERFMPLRVIREVMTDDPERAARGLRTQHHQVGPAASQLESPRPAGQAEERRAPHARTELPGDDDARHVRLGGLGVAHGGPDDGRRRRGG